MAADDRELVLMCREGREEACRQLLSRYEGYVYSLCYRLTGRREDALDLSQEAFFKAVAGLPGFQANRPFKPWLRQVVVNVCLNYLRRQPPETLSLDQTAGGNFSLAGALAAGHEDDPQARLEWLETKEALRAALERLPPLWRLVLALRHQEELSYQEIAAVTGLPLGTVKTYLFRARNLLRRVFSEIYGWEEDQQ